MAVVLRLVPRILAVSAVSGVVFVGCGGESIQRHSTPYAKTAGANAHGAVSGSAQRLPDNAPTEGAGAVGAVDDASIVIDGKTQSAIEIKRDPSIPVIATDTVGMFLGFGGEVVPASKPVEVSARDAGERDALDYSKFWIDLTVTHTDSGAALHARDQLALIYKVTRSDGRIVLGAVPASLLKTQDNGARVAFALRGRGIYQAARIASSLKAELTKVTSERAATAPVRGSEDLDPTRK